MGIVDLILNVALIVMIGVMIYFVARLHKRLEIIRGGKNDLERLLTDLVVTTTRAEQSLSGLRNRAEALNETLGKQVTGAENAREELGYLLASADRNAGELMDLLERAKKVSAAAPVSVPAPAAVTPMAVAPKAEEKPAAPTDRQPRRADDDLLKAIEKLR